jgi:hypothetical protein
MQYRTFGKLGWKVSQIGATYFCPACAHNSAIADFKQTIETTLKAVDLLDQIVETVTEHSDENAAANIVDCTSLASYFSTFALIPVSMASIDKNKFTDSYRRPSETLFSQCGSSDAFHKLFVEGGRL